MAQHKMSFTSAFLACFLGISIGDLGLYFIGYTIHRFNLGHQKGFFAKYRASLSTIKNSKILTYSIVISRFIPGTRLITYLGAGFVQYSLWQFLGLTVITVFLWVLVALLSGKSLNLVFTNHWILLLTSYLFCINIFKSFIPKLSNHWQRKALLHSWRKWLYFEFWPAPFFYLPIVPYYIFLAIKHRSLFMPFYACPHMAHGGLIGESKWDFLKHLNPNDFSTLKTLKINKDIEFLKVREILSLEQIEFPFIIKPDVGQRGFAVRIIRSDSELSDYLIHGSFDRIIQKLSLLPGEAGIFYVRKPSELVGRIFSITDKRFPFVLGDGKTKLGDLILQDPRARIIAAVYFERLKQHLDNILARNEKFYLSECGNHCQGAIFLNGNQLVSEQLTQAIDKVAKQIPDFYFGRFDVRYLNHESLTQGKNFEIVEVNGAGSEATHIWDPDTKLTEAYFTLFEQWSLLFAIGNEVHLLPIQKTQLNIFGFLKECAKVAFRKGKLVVSS